MPPLSEEKFKAWGNEELIYLRPIKGSVILEEFERAGYVSQVKIDPEQILYGVYGADGSRLAVLSDREAGVDLAKEYELKVVTLH